MVRRLAGSHIDDAGSYLVVQSPDHPTFYWGNFLLVPGPPAPGDVSMWLDQFASAFPSADHVAIGIDGSDVGLAAMPGWKDARLEFESSVVLTAQNLIAPGQPTGPISRPLRSDLDWRQATELRKAVAASEGSTSRAHQTFLSAAVAEARGLSEAGHASYFGAFADDRLCSYLGLVDDGGPLARFQTVETHPAYRRRGLAGALIYLAGVHGLEDRGATTLVIVADPGGPAINLYRKLGFTEIERQAQLERPIES